MIPNKATAEPTILQPKVMGMVVDDESSLLQAA